MARYRGPRLKIIRRLGTSLPGLMRTSPELKRPYAPGQHGPTKRPKLSNYALRLREKQKLRFHYGISEAQLKRYVASAFSSKGNPSLILLTLLERRLDNVLFRANFTPTIAAARQMVRHGHIIVNGNRIDIPSRLVDIGDNIELQQKSRLKSLVQKNLVNLENLSVPDYLSLSDKGEQLQIKSIPSREDIPIVVNEQLIVEYYAGK